MKGDNQGRRKEERKTVIAPKAISPHHSKARSSWGPVQSAWSGAPHATGTSVGPVAVSPTAAKTCRTVRDNEAVPQLWCPIR